jgi:molybdopterin molybdotransferase
MIPLDEAQTLVLSSCSPLPARPVVLDDALGCVTARVVVAESPVPSFVNSAMDGFAVRSSDVTTVPTRLQVVASIAAGSTCHRALLPGEAARIMTGAAVPEGADAVCPVEQTHGNPLAESVDVLALVGPGTNVRYPGEDLRPGDRVIEPGIQLSPAHQGLLASLGIEQIVVVPSPRVGVLSTGDELTAAAGSLAPGKIRDANRHALLAAVRQMGCTPIDLGIVGDDEVSVSSVLAKGARSCDAIVTSGGVSVGDFDVMRVVLEKECNGTMRWLQIAMKPGKPFAFGVLDASRIPVFGLPGNPVSALVSFELIVRPALRLLGGHRLLHHPVLHATATSAMHRKRDGKLHVVRAIAHFDGRGRLLAEVPGQQASHLLRTMADSNAFVPLPEGEGVDSGAPVKVILPAIDRVEQMPARTDAEVA